MDPPRASGLAFTCNGGLLVIFLGSQSGRLEAFFFQGVFSLERIAVQNNHVFDPGFDDTLPGFRSIVCYLLLKVYHCIAS
jgi:hypothetical protein